MLDPLTAISLASAVVQFTDFGVKLVTGSIELYHSVDGVSAERSNLERNITRVRNLTDKIILPLEQNDDHVSSSNENEELKELTYSCKIIASDLLSVLDGLKVKSLAGPRRKWESFQKAVAAQTPHNKNKIAALEKSLRTVQGEIFNHIQAMMRYYALNGGRALLISSLQSTTIPGLDDSERPR